MSPVICTLLNLTISWTKWTLHLLRHILLLKRVKYEFQLILISWFISNPSFQTKTQLSWTKLDVSTTFKSLDRPLSCKNKSRSELSSLFNRLIWLIFFCQTQSQLNFTQVSQLSLPSQIWTQLLNNWANLKLEKSEYVWIKFAIKLNILNHFFA